VTAALAKRHGFAGREAWGFGGHVEAAYVTTTLAKRPGSAGARSVGVWGPCRGRVCDYNAREAPRLRRGAERGGLGAMYCHWAPYTRTSGRSKRRSSVGWSRASPAAVREPHLTIRLLERLHGLQGAQPAITFR